MKIAGWICTILGALSLLGTLIGGNSPIGPLFWLGLGIFLLYRGYNKDEEHRTSNSEDSAHENEVSGDVLLVNEPEQEPSVDPSLSETVNQDVATEVDHADSMNEHSDSAYGLILEFADTKVAVNSMAISKTYERYSEGNLEAINHDIIAYEKEKIMRAGGSGIYLVPPIFYGEESHSFFGPHAMLGDWRLEIKFELWVKSTPDKTYSDQLYKLTLIIFSNKISDDQIPLSQHLSQYTKTLNFFELAHKCTDDEMNW